MNFEEFIERKKTNSVKWDMMKEFGKPEDVIPLWVADMDFRVPEGIIQAFKNQVEHGIFGYTRASDEYYQAIMNWMKRRHNWEIEKEWILMSPGIIPALNFIIQTYTSEGDAILIQRPVYPPFSGAIDSNHRKLINSPLILKHQHYEIDFDDFENKIVKNKVKLFILCSPHNPVGRLWTKEELVRIGDICLKHDVLIVADEIHHDLVYKGYKHIPFASLGKKYSDNCITCTAPSKTFNLAGLKVSNVIIENEEIRKQLQKFLERIHLTSVNLFGMIACEAAYNTGEEWLDAVMDYIYENKKFVEKFVGDKHLKIKITKSEATYLLWLDFREYGMTEKEIEHFITNEAKLWFNEGYSFGKEGSGFVRMNLACPRSIIQQALNQLKEALDK